MLSKGSGIGEDDDRYSRKDFRKLGGRRHDKALVGAGPGNEMLDALIFEHAVDVELVPTMLGFSE